MKKYMTLLLFLLSIKTMASVSVETQEPFFFKLRPDGTYLDTDANGGIDLGNGKILPEKSSPAARFDFTPPLNDLRPGDVIRISGSGLMTAGNGMPNWQQGIGGVFVDINGKHLSTFGLKRTKVFPIYSMNTCTINNLTTDIYEDFYIPYGNIINNQIVDGAEAQIPEGAVALLVGVVDCYYADNRDLDLDFGVQIQVLKSKNKLEKKLFNDVIELGDSTKEQIVPSNVYKNSQDKSKSSSRVIRVRCLDENDEAQDNCKLSLKLRLKEGKENNGGHEHTEGNRPLGTLTIDGTKYENEAIKVPIKKEEKGTKIVYDAPEVSGVVELEFKVYDVDDIIITKGVTNTTFTVRIVEDLVPINIPELTIVNMSEGESHPKEGFYLTPLSLNKLDKIVKSYLDFFREDEKFIQLKTEAASLKWGGLYDINKNWSKGHVEHRDGNDIDLSLSVFHTNIDPEVGKNAKGKLQKSIVLYSLGYPYARCEGPRENETYPKSGKPCTPTHWHVHFEKIRD